VNDKTDECWAIDWNIESNNTKIVKISNTGTKLFEISGFTGPQSLDVDPYDGSCLVADTGNFRVVKISSEGDIIGESILNTRPFIIRVVTQ
jgi:hypothetical protein